MRLRVGQRQRFGRLGDEAHEAFAAAHGCQMDGFAVQTFGGEKLEPPVRSQHIERAHLRHHVGGDVHDDLVEPGLSVDRLGHGFAKPAQKQARAAVGGAYGPFLFRHRGLAALPAEPIRIQAVQTARRSLFV